MIFRWTCILPNASNMRARWCQY